MVDEKLQIFVDGAIQYFTKFGGTKARVGTPFLTSTMSEHFEQYTSFISISGTDVGTVFFTSSYTILEELLKILNINQIDEANMIDLAGEIANTISGNAREVLGHEFIISTPIVFNGTQQAVVKITETPKIHVIPILWRDYRANLIVSLD